MHRPQRLSFAHPVSRKRRLTVTLLPLMAFLMLGPRPAQAYGDPAQGHQLAATWCSNCHQVEPRTQILATDAVPSFRAVAVMSSTTSMSIHAFLRTSHDVMPDFRLTEPQIDDVSAYILDLRTPTPE